MHRSTIQQKINRINSGQPPRVLDLFAGCGGLSLGFQTAGYKISGAVEIDSRAIETHAMNFFNSSDQLVQEMHSQVRDIRHTDPKQLITEFSPDCEYNQSIDVIIGGPPCQAFSRVGRAKLRDVREDPNAFLNDPRSSLYLKYLKYVKQLKPIALLMENVPDMLDFGGRNLAEEICEALSDLGYVCRYTLLNAAFFGVPQMRERLFIMAFACELNRIPSFPEPTHWMDLPKGYHSTRNAALRALRSSFFTSSFFVTPPEPSNDLPPAITVKEAIEDLPVVTSHLEGKIRKGIRRFDTLLQYSKNESLSSYMRLMRTWPGFENDLGVYDQVIRYLPRDYPIFKRMNHGDEYPQAYQHALDLFNERLDLLKEEGKEVKQGSPEYEALKKEIVPPYDPSKFANKWRKLQPDKPSRTLMAHLGKDGYSHIHYDSKQARTITPREAARLQSFPDGFVFSGAMNSAFRQIGNAVPPILANALACEIAGKIGFNAYNVLDGIDEI